MSMSDPIADMLTRIRNANTAKHDVVDVPASKMKIALPISSLMRDTSQNMILSKKGLTKRSVSP